MSTASEQTLPVRNAGGKPEKPDQKRAKSKAKPVVEENAAPFELEPPPEFIDWRNQLFDTLKANYNETLGAKARSDITVTLPDGSSKPGNAWETTPSAIALAISKSLLEKTVIAKVNDELWDLDRPLEQDCKLQLLDFEHPEGKKVFWHSSAHVLGEAAERKYGCHLCNGPPTEDPPGFYYDMGNMGDYGVRDSDRKSLETLVNRMVKEKQPFERLMVSKDQLLEMFKYSKYKIHFIKEKVPDGSSSTVYRCGSLIDLCLGPHVPHTGRVKCLAILKNSSSYWLGNSSNEALQRIAGISFPDKKQLEEHKKFLEEAAKRHHKKIGQDQKLFFFDEVSPGCCFFLPHGARIYNTLLELVKSEYFKRGYDEVVTPNMYKADLWKTSGHWNHYEENMFTFDVEKERFGLKPMNCPGHCKIFSHSEMSYRNLPWRMADFGVLHRNEFSGALTGLTRVRRFVQDDAHVFCTEDQILEEIAGIFDFISNVYGLFGFTFRLRLSTRPEKYLGDIRTWDAAEAQLRQALDAFTQKVGVPWEENPQDGAFYGPKIDIALFDALRREHQCGTIQLDFQLPQRFNLRYQTGDTHAEHLNTKGGEGDAKVNGAIKTENIDKANDEASSQDALPYGYARPVMIHRAIMGSFERMIGILTEHFGGKWPFWLSPRQILVIPVMPSANDYVKEVQKIFKEQGMFVDVDLSANTMQKKIRAGQLEQYNFIFVVGAEEQKTRTVNVRNRDDQSRQSKGDLVPMSEALDKLKKLKEERNIQNNFQ